MRISGACFGLRFVSRGRTWRLIGGVVSTFVLAGWLAGSAAATTIHVNTTRESAIFNPHGPGGENEAVSTSTGVSRIVGQSRQPGQCSLRQAINAANNPGTHDTSGGVNDMGDCPVASGNDTIMLPAGNYNVQDNLFIRRRMTIRGPNAGLAGNNPNRHPEAVISFNNNPNWASQISLFWLNNSGSGTGSTTATGTVFDGIEMRGGFRPDCAQAGPCDVTSIVQPVTRDVEQGYTVTNSIIRNFSMGVYLGGTDTITNNLFEDNNCCAGAPSNGNDVYGDLVFVTQNSVIRNNVFRNPQEKAVTLTGDANRGRVDGTVIEDNIIYKESNHSYGIFVSRSSGGSIRNNVLIVPSPPPCGSRGTAAIRLDKVDSLDITGNTMVGWGAGLSVGDTGLSGSPGTTGVAFNFNRVYDNCVGVQVTPAVCVPNSTTDYTPLAIDANDNWWGANGGPGSDGARPGAGNPVNGVEFFECDGTTPVPNQGGITVDRWLHLSCTAPATVYKNVPADVSGHVVGMPTVDSSATSGPWFVDERQPLMEGSSDLGDVYGFGRVPTESPHATLNGSLVATRIGDGEFVVALDSEQVACPLRAEEGPETDVGKDAETPTVAAGGLARYRITVANRGRRTARNWWVCDVMPRGMSSVSATPRLRRLGRMRCLVIGTLRPRQRVSFELTARVARNASGTETNIEEVIPGPPTGGDPVVPPGPPAVGKPPHYRPIGEDRADVTVVRRPRPSGFTG